MTTVFLFLRLCSSRDIVLSKVWAGSAIRGSGKILRRRLICYGSICGTEFVYGHTFSANRRRTGVGSETIRTRETAGSFVATKVSGARRSGWRAPNDGSNVRRRIPRNDHLGIQRIDAKDNRMSPRRKSPGRTPL